MPLWMVIAIIALESAVGIYLWQKGRVKRQRLHHIKVKSARGVVNKLVLNDTQYQQFTEFLSRPDGIFDIESESAKVFLERRYVAAVEVRVR